MQPTYSNTSYESLILIFSWTVLSVIIFFPATVIFTSGYIKHRRHPFIQSRFPEGVLAQSIAFSYILLVYHPVWLLSLIFNIHPRVVNISNMFANFFLAAVAHRVWLIFYAYKYRKEMVASRVDNRSGFFRRCAKGLGDSARCFVALILLTLCLIALATSLIFLTDVAGQWIVSGSYFAFFTIASPIVLFQISRWDDTMYFKSELIPLGICFILFVGFLVTRYAVFELHNRLVIDAVLGCAVQMILGLFVIYLQTRYVLVLMGRRDDVLTNDAWGDVIPLRQFCASSEGYGLFLEFLARDYATENMFFVSEVVQFCREFLPRIRCEPACRLNQLWNLAPKMPQSDIMREIDWRKRFAMIFEVYVSFESVGENCVNISYRLRENLIELYQSHFGQTQTRRSLSSAFQKWKLPSEREISGLMESGQSIVKVDENERPFWLQTMFQGIRTDTAIAPLCDEHELDFFVQVVEALVPAALELQSLMMGSYHRFVATEEYLNFANIHGSLSLAVSD